jgi:hypothetical protein
VLNDAVQADLQLDQIQENPSKYPFPIVCERQFLDPK